MILRCIVNHDFDQDEQWRVPLNAFYEGRGNRFKASVPFDETDRLNIAGLRKALSIGHGK